MSLKAFFESHRSELSGSIEFEAPLSKVSYYRMGGAAEVLVTPRSLDDLALIHRGIHETRSKFFILGWGSNLLFSDAGYRGVVVRMKYLFSEIDESEPGILKVGASVGGSTLLRKAQECGFGGLEHLTGIPGSVGGMIAMNAGTHLGEMKKSCRLVRSIDLVHETLDIREHIVRDESFSYRKNHFLTPSELVISGELKYFKEDPSLVKKTIDELYQRRKQTQPVDYPSCGSVFMNPREAGLHAWQVVDRLGLRGHRIGNAQFAEKHSNFIINLGGATALDVKTLIDLAKSRAQSELGIILREEVKWIE
jgi:UDP-N-acetylmuramate dehydrogenase